MDRFTKRLLAVAICAILAAIPIALYAQSIDSAATRVQGSSSLYPLVAISSTAAVNNQVTLTIPAPASGWYNYVCYLSYHASQDGTATAQTNAVTTNTNFGTFALKYSLTATATINYHEDFYFGSPATGCIKSTSPSTATTFVSPAAGANIAFTWKASYYQAP